MITPFVTIWYKSQVPQDSEDLVKKPIIAEPTKHPNTVPTPPVKLVPPMIADAIASP